MAKIFELVFTLLVGGWILILFTAPVMLINAWAVVVLWAWFVLPIVPFLPPLGYAQAIGIQLVMSAILPHPTSLCEDKRTISEKVGVLIEIALAPVFLVGVGWLVRYFGGL